jgi:hypothetical protein
MLEGMVFPSPGYHVSDDRAAAGAQITLWFAAVGSSCEPSNPWGDSPCGPAVGPRTGVMFTAGRAAALGDR